MGLSGTRLPPGSRQAPARLPPGCWGRASAQNGQDASPALKEASNDFVLSSAHDEERELKELS